MIVHVYTLTMYNGPYIAQACPSIQNVTQHIKNSPLNTSLNSPGGAFLIKFEAMRTWKYSHTLYTYKGMHNIIILWTHNQMPSSHGIKVAMIGKESFTEVCTHHSYMCILYSKATAIYSRMSTWHYVSQGTACIQSALSRWTRWRAAYNVFAGYLRELLYTSSDCYRP